MKYLEIDVRVSSDGEFFVNHDPVTNTDYSQRVVLKNTHSSTVREIFFQNGEKILSLADALHIFSQRSKLEQILCIDIKDYGYEEILLTQVRKFGLEHKVVFISGIPQSLVSLAKLGTLSPLILSHWNSMAWGLIGSLLTNFLHNTVLSIFSFIVLGKSKYSMELNRKAVGFNYTILLDELPNEMIDILSQNGGGVCVHKTVATHKLRKYCEQRNLSFWVFSVSNQKEYNKYISKLGVDVIFCDKQIKGV